MLKALSKPIISLLMIGVCLLAQEEIQPVMILRRHIGCVNSVAFSPDGKLLASGGDDEIIYLWNVSDGSIKHVSRGHRGSVNSVAFSPDGSLLASGSSDATVKLWRVADGSILHNLKKNTFGVNAVAFSPNGNLLASGGSDFVIRLWQVDSGTLFHFFIGHTKNINALCFSPDGKYLVSNSDDNTIRLWQISSGKPLNVLKNRKTGDTKTVIFNHNSDVLASGGMDNSISIWNVKTGLLTNSFLGKSKSDNFAELIWIKEKSILSETGHWGCVNSIVITTDDDFLFSASDDQTVKLWFMSSGELAFTFKAGDAAIKSISLSPDNHYLACGGKDQQVRVYDVSRSIPFYGWFIQNELDKVELLYLSDKKKYNSLGKALGYKYLKLDKPADAEKVFLYDKVSFKDLGEDIGRQNIQTGKLSDAERIYLYDKESYRDLGAEIVTQYLKTKKLSDAERVYLSDNLSFKDLGKEIFKGYLESEQLSDAERIFFCDTTNFQYLGRKLVDQYLITNRYTDALRVIKVVRPDLYLALKQLVAESYVDSYQKALTKFTNRADFTKENNPLQMSLIKLFKDQIPPLEVIESADQNSNKNERLKNICIANYYVGFKYDMEGKRNLAGQYYNQTIATNQTELVEYNLAARAAQNVTVLDTKIDAGLRTIAVTDFEANGFTPDEAKVIASRTSQELIKRQSFTVLERAKMDQILKEQGFQLSGCTSDECVVEVGQLLGVQLMLAGSIGRFGELNIIDMRIIDVETSKIVKSTSYEIKGEKEILLTTGVGMALNDLLR